MNKPIIIKLIILFVILFIARFGQYSFCQTSPTIDHGDDAITDAHESFKDRGMRPYQDLVNITPSAMGFETYVNLVYGNLIHTRQDLYIPGRGLPLRIVFTYNSGSFFDGRYGYGWQMNYNVRYVTNSENGNIIIVRPDDRTDIFEAKDDGTYTATYGVRDNLAATDNGFKLNVYRDTWNNNGEYSVYYFDSPDHHNVTRIEDRNGNTLTFKYNGDKQLITVTDASGRNLQLTYAGNQLVKINDPSGREFQYQYDANGDMTQYTDPLGGEWAYTYSEDCHDCLSITDANGNAYPISYDENYAISTVGDPDAGTLFTFNYSWTNGRNTTLTDGNGNNSIYAYDEMDRVTSVTNGLGQSTIRVWDNNYNLTSLTDGNGNTSNFTYDEKGNQLTVVDPLGNTVTTTWDELYRRQISTQDANGNTTNLTRDAKGNLTEQTNALGNTTQFTYDEFGQLSNVTNALGHITTYEYDGFGNVTKIINGLGGEKSFTHDARGNSLTESDENGNVTTHTYDTMNRRTKTTNALGGEIRYQWDAVGNQISVTDARSNQTEYVYDSTNRLISITDALGGITNYRYDIMGNRTAETDPNGNTTNFTFDGTNRLTTKTDAAGGTTSYGLDAVGNLTSKTDANSNTIQYIYDAANRMTSKTDPMGNSTIYDYDVNGNKTSQTDANGATTTFQYDAADQLTRKLDALGGQTDYEYDAVGNRISVTDQNRNITIHDYIAEGRLLGVINPLNNRWTYGYDAVGNIIQRTDANGNTTNYTYDALNRKIQTSYTEGNIDWEYDANGNLIRAKNHFGIQEEIILEYDALNRLTNKSVDYKNPVGLRTVSYTYDNVGNRQSMTYSDGTIAAMQYDAANRTVQLTSFDGVSQFEYDLGGRKTRMTNAAGMVFSVDYDAADRPVSMKIDSAGKNFANRTYEYDAVGNKIIEVRNEDSTYRKIMWDAKHQRTQIVYGDSSSGSSLMKNGMFAATEEIQEFTYDPVGNRISKSVNSAATTYTYNDDSRLIQETTPTETITYAHDNNGNRRSGTNSSGITNFQYDSENRLINYTEPSGRSATYSYSAFGQKIKMHRQTPDYNYSQYYVYSGKEKIETWFDHLWMIRNPGISLMLSPGQSTEKIWYTLFDPFGTSIGEMQDHGFHKVDFDELGKKLEGTVDPEYLDNSLNHITNFIENWDDPYLINFDPETFEIVNGTHPTQTQTVIQGKTPEQTYQELQSIFSKKLAGGWMLDASFTYSDWKRHRQDDEYPDMSNFDFFNSGPMAEPTTGSGLSDIFVNSRWMVKLTGMYQLPWGINVTTFFQAREGNPHSERNHHLTTGTNYIYRPGSKVGDQRLPTFWMLNLGLEKTLKITDTVTTTLAIDWYNATNNQIELKHNLSVDGEINTDEPQPVMWTNAGLFQFGVRVNF